MFFEISETTSLVLVEVRSTESSDPSDIAADIALKTVYVET
jgi:hypothetical protein